MSSVSPQIGKGFFQNIQRRIFNTLSGRKAITKKLFKPLDTSTQQNILQQIQRNTRRRNTLKQKKQRSKKENQELKVLQESVPALQLALQAKLAPPEEIYEAQKQRLLDARPAKQKSYNKYYPEENQPAPTMNSRILVLKKNTRNPLLKEALNIPDSNLPEPLSVEGSAYRNVNGERIELAGQATVTYINAPLYYAQWKQEEPRERLEDISDEEFNEFVEALTDPEDVRTLFHIPDGISSESWFQEMEEGAGFTEGRFQFVNFRYTFEDGMTIEKRLIKAPASVSIPRLFADLKNGKNQIIKNVEADLCTCVSPWDTNNTPEHYTPLTTLKSNGCIQVLRDENDLEPILMFGLQAKGFLIIPPPYNKQMIPIAAKYLRSMRMFREALDDWAILGMDSLLWKLFETKYPEISIKVSTHIFTNFKDKIPLYLRELKYTENFIVVDKSIEFEKNTKDFMGMSYMNPFSSGSKYFPKLRQAIQQKKLYGVTPYMAYFMKKTVPTLWTQAFERNQANFSTYITLNAHEKIAIDYLQHLRFIDVLLDNNYDFVEARNTYEDLLGDGSPMEGIMKEVIDLYKEDIPKHATEIRFFQSLVTRQLEPDETPAFITSPEDITALLLKFTGPAIDFAPRRNRFSALAEAISAPLAERSVAPLTLRAPAQAPRNQLTQLQSRLAALKNERNNLQRNSPLYTTGLKTRRNRNEVNRMYKNMLSRLGTFSRFTKTKERKNIEIKRNVAKATFNRLEALNRNIQDLEQQVARVGRV
jgi:hypothetical protein